MAVLRIPNMRGIMAARTKPLAVENGTAEGGSRIERFALPPEKGDCKIIDAENAVELIRLLREEAKII